MQDRVKSLAGVRNLRDFGGYPTASGRLVKRGLLYRSAHFAEATEDDLRHLQELGIGFVVDLRRNNEREKYPSRWPSGAQPQLVVHDSGHEAEPPHITFLRDPKLTPARTREYMQRDYAEMPFDPRYIWLYSQFLKKLAAGEGPVLVHCMAGKDRTGIICGTLLKLLGVSHDHVVEDYLLTNVIRGEADFEHRAKQISEMLGCPLNVDVLRPMWVVEGDYLERSFAAMKRQSGSLDNYVERVLKLTAAERDALHRNLVE